MLKPNILLIDDEPQVALALELMLKKLCLDAGTIKVCHSVLEAIKIYKQTHQDIVFLDVEMPQGSGFDFIDIIDPAETYVIFSTAHAQHALKAIQNGARDYLLKPIHPDDLLHSMKKAMDFLRRDTRPENLSGNLIPVHCSGNIHFIPKEDILYLKADGRYSEIYCTEKRRFVVCKNIGEYEAALGNDYFFRVHKSFLINCRHVKSICSADGGFVEMKDQLQIEISKRRKADFLKFLK